MSRISVLEKENAELKRSVNELIMLNDLARTINALGDSEEIIAKIIQHSLKAVNGEQGVITLIDKESNDPVRTLVRSMSTTGDQNPIHLKQFLLGWIDKNRVPLLVNNPRRDERFPNLVEEESIRSILCVPLIVKSEFIGVLAIYNKKEKANFTEEDMRVLSILASHSAQIIENARLFEREQEMKMKQLKLQQEIHFRKEEAKRLQELNEMKSFFVSSVSHELKTPLTSIKMFAEILETQPNIISDQREYLQIIYHEAERLTRLINNVLDLTKIEYKVKEYNFSIVDVHDVIKTVLQLMQYQFKMNECIVETSFSREDFIIHADQDAVIQAIINLLANAMKYSSDEKRILIRTFTKDSFVCIRVEDRGIGISEEDVHKIFDPFYRASLKQHSAGGAGIGLTLVQHIMNAHNGKIDVGSKLGEGSAFTLSFPLKEREA